MGRGDDASRENSCIWKSLVASSINQMLYHSISWRVPKSRKKALPGKRNCVQRWPDPDGKYYKVKSQYNAITGRVTGWRFLCIHRKLLRREPGGPT